jgi:hypothetical protein
MRSIIIVIFELIIQVSLQAQDFTTIQYCNNKFLNIEEGLSALQRHCFSSNGDTLVVINRDSIFIFDFVAKKELRSKKLPFSLDDDAKFGGLVDFVNGSLIALQIHPAEPCCDLRFVIYNKDLEIIKSSTTKTQEWITITNFLGRIRIIDDNLVFDDMVSTKEALFVNMCTGEQRYEYYKRSSIYDAAVFGQSFNTINFMDLRKVIGDSLSVESAVGFNKNIVAFCEDKSNSQCKYVLVDKSKNEIFNIVNVNDDCSAVKLFDSGFSWFKDGCFYQVIMPQDKRLLKEKR